MRDKKDRVWFVQPKSADSNRSIVSGLQDSGEENFLPEVACVDGKRRSLIRIDFDYAKHLLQSRKENEGLKFRLWYMDRLGPIVPSKAGYHHKKKLEVMKGGKVVKI